MFGATDHEFCEDSEDLFIRCFTNTSVAPLYGNKLNPSTVKQKCIVVLGMHRSGTSAIMRVVNLLGVYLGTNLYPPKPHNPRGLWENREIMEIHESLFDYFGNHWLDFLAPLPENWWLNDNIQPFKLKLVNIVRQNFSKSSIWGLKDPRLCRLLPLWYSIFKEISCQPYFIHIIRNPLEVAASLKKRNRLTQNVALLLWLQHILESEKSSRGYPRVFVTFDLLMQDWRMTMKKIEKILGLKWPKDTNEVAEQVDSFLSPGLKHYNLSESFVLEENHLSSLITETYKVLIKASKEDYSELVKFLNDIFASWKEGIQTEPSRMLIEDLRFLRLHLDEVEYNLKDRNVQLAQCNAQLAQRNAQLAQRNARLAEIRNSRSWRLTAPLRSDLMKKIHRFIQRTK